MPNNDVPHPFARSAPYVRPPWVAPSLLAADASRLGDEAAAVRRAGADWLHVDVMDGHFVHNLAFGPNVVQSLRACTALPLDVHLMVERPQQFIEPFVRAGADMITFHVEACDDAEALIARIRALGARAGISARPDTPHVALTPLLPLVDLVLVMGVAPGFGGQGFLPDTPARLRALARARAERGARCTLQVDGGINPKTAQLALEAGADALVAGSAVFQQTGTAGHAASDGYGQRLAALRGRAQTPKG